jgi:Putative DnaT-like ssDNA binding protein
MPTVIATPNTADANSYATRVRADAYWATRTFSPVWTTATNDLKDTALIMATRTMDMMLSPYRYWVPPTSGVNGREGYYRTRPTWTGARAAANLSRLAWGRSGMLDRNGVAIPENVFPEELAEATSELAGSMIKSDRLVDNSVAVKGITDIKAGPVSLSFDGSAMTSKVLPDAVLYLLVPSWLTAEVIEATFPALFDVVSR